MGAKTSIGWWLAAALGALLAFGPGPASAHKSHKPISVWTKPAKMTAAEREDWDGVNADRALARVGPVASAAVLQKIANKRVREMAARRSDYAGYDVSVDLKRAHLCFKKSMEIEDQLEGGGGGSYSYIEQAPQWTQFADAILTTDGQTYTVEDYVRPCGAHSNKPLKLPKASLKLDGLAVSVGSPGPDASLTPSKGPETTVTDPAACNPSAGLYAVVDYSGVASATLTGVAPGGVGDISQPAGSGRVEVLIADGPLSGNYYGFDLGATVKLKLPDGDRVPVTPPAGEVGIKRIAVTPSC
jgi:hypothetical protein